MCETHAPDKHSNDVNTDAVIQTSVENHLV